MASTQAEGRLRTRILSDAHEQFLRQGEIHLTRPRVIEIAAEEGVDEADAEHVLGLLIEEGFIEAQTWHHSTAGAETALFYETDIDRPAFWRANELRRRLILAGAGAYRADEEPMLKREERGSFSDVEWGELWSAVKVLESLGLSNQRRAMGTIRLNVTAEGYELSRDETALAGALPVSAAEDEAAHRAVAADALRELIRDTEQMLRDRGWESALAELSRGDRQLEKGDWVDAVREYYAALESGLKHRLDEFGAKYNERDALRDLAKHAARTGAIPRNYQDLFSFPDSIRSPRSHGAGVKTVEVEVGPAEALLMGNHVRALLLYLGQRPRNRPS